MGSDGAGENSGPKPRRLEFRGDGSAKFWEISREGESYTVTFGRIGTAGTSQTKELDDEDDARKAVARLIAEKLRKGYVEAGIPTVAGNDWTRPETWRRLRDGIQVWPARWGKPAPLPTVAEMDAFEAAHGFELPPSYRAFLQVFGPGDVTIFRIAAPGGPAHYSLEEMAEEARRRLEDESIDFASDEYVGLEPVTRMVVFCAWDSDRWGWDRGERDAHGEYVIRRWYRSYPVAEAVAASFPEFIIEKLLLNGMFRFDDPDEPSFAPAVIRAGARNAAARPAKSEKEARPRATKPKKRSAREENEFLHRIAADPADEAAQRAYAEWLDRFRDPVAGVIRARLGGDEARGAGKIAEKEPLLARGLLPWVLHRLGAHIRLNDEGQIHHIDVKDYQVNAGALREFSRFPALRELELNAHALTPEELDALGGLTGLRELHLHDVGLTDDGLKAIARLTGLEYLCLIKPGTQGRGFTRLKGLAKLETLVLDLPDGARLPAHLAALASWKALRGLFLGQNRLTGKDLAGLDRLRRVERLGLEGNPLRNGDLARITGLTGLKWLNLEDTEITGKGMEHLKGLRSLEVLRTRKMPNAEAATPWLARLTSLRELALPGSHGDGNLTDTGLAHLAVLTRLKTLNVQSQRLTDAGLVHLAGLAELEELDLCYNRGVAGPGLEHLKRLRKLQRLKLDSTGLTNAAVPLLKEFAGLEELGLFGTKIGGPGLATLRRALPKVNL
jgi:predicted DNA-binding WGR domain protein